jgi:hypothetical protein
VPGPEDRLIKRTSRWLPWRPVALQAASQLDKLAVGDFQIARYELIWGVWRAVQNWATGKELACTT